MTAAAPRQTDFAKKLKLKCQSLGAMAQSVSVWQLEVWWCGITRDKVKNQDFNYDKNLILFENAVIFIK